MGEEPWDGPMTLYDILEGPQEIDSPLHKNYPMTLLNPHCMEEFDFERFRTDAGKVFRIVMYQQDRTMLRRIFAENPDNPYDRMTREACLLIEAMVGIKMMAKAKKEGGGYSMCQAMREILEEERALGREEGVGEGRNQGREEGREEGSRSTLLHNIHTLMQTMGWDAQTCMTNLRVPPHEQKNIFSRLAATTE